MSKRTTSPAVNKQLRALGYCNLRLRAGNGCHYFTFCDGIRFAEQRVPVAKVSEPVAV